MQSQAYGISYGVSHPNLGGQNNGGTNVVSSASSSDDEADKNASGKRKRPMSVSCELCKQRKVKCDRGQPSCGWCTRNDQMCEYRERRKPGLRAGYGRDLERRLDRLEEMVTTHDRLFEEYLRPSPSVQEANAASSVDANLHSLAPIGHISNSSPSQTMEAGPPLVSRTSHLSAGQQVAHPQLQAERQSVQGPPGHHDTAQPVSALTGSLYQERPNKDQPWYYAKPRSAATNIAQAQLPPHELLYSLVNLYFEHINTWFPILHRQTTFEILFGSTSLSEADCMMLHAIVATTLRFCNDPGLTRDEQDQYHDSSKQRVLLYALENSSVRSLQAMVILALDLTGTVNGPPAWNLLALITRNIIHLGLASESTSSMGTPTRPSIYTLRAAVLSEPETWIEDEERRRLFWGAYILDRYATISTAFDFGLNEKEIVRRLPCDNTLFVANIPAETSWFSPLGRLSYAEYHTENLGSFAFYCELLGIISRIHQFLKRPVDIGSAADVAQWQKSYRDLDDELTSWRISLPEQTSEAFLFQSSPESMNERVNSCWIMLHATCHTAVMRLHTSAAYPTFRSTFFKPSYNAIQRCIRAASSVEDLSRWVVGTSRLDVLGPPFAFSLWVAARVLLVHASTVEPQTSPDIGVFVSILSQMGRRWRVAGRYGEILDRVVQEYQQSRLSMGSSEEQSTAATVKILADMRRCAYDLDVLISRQPRPKSNQRVTTAKTPASAEFEYHDVFDFFNMPRLPLQVEQNVSPGNQGRNQAPLPDLTGMNELNITNYLVPTPESDWLAGGNTFWA